MIAGLPEDALLARPAGQTEVWTRTHELLASLVEVVSVSAAERALKKPLQIPRPYRAAAVRAQQPDQVPEEEAVPVGQAVEQFAAMGRVRKAPQRALTAGPAAAGVPA